MIRAARYRWSDVPWVGWSPQNKGFRVVCVLHAVDIFVQYNMYLFNFIYIHMPNIYHLISSQLSKIQQKKIYIHPYPYLLKFSHILYIYNIFYSYVNTSSLQPGQKVPALRVRPGRGDCARAEDHHPDPSGAAVPRHYSALGVFGVARGGRLTHCPGLP